MGSMVSCWWESVSQETAVALEGEVSVYWVGCVGARLRKPDTAILGERLSVESFTVRRVVGFKKKNVIVYGINIIFAIYNRATMLMHKTKRFRVLGDEKRGKCFSGKYLGKDLIKEEVRVNIYCLEMMIFLWRMDALLIK